MSLPQYVYRRGEQLQYRRAYPKDLWPVTRRAPFAMSLRTGDASQAAQARPEAERLYNARVYAARLELARLAAAEAGEGAQLSKNDAEAIAVDWFLSSLQSADELRAG